MKYIRWFSELGNSDVPLVGGKNASLGEMYCELGAVGVRVPNGFEGARRNGRHAGICCQAPSDYPEFAQYLVELGIDSISVTPDKLLDITRAVLSVEARLGRAPRSAARSQEAA